jgi:hypothetical protein
MSISDFSLSSPRKAATKRNVITADRSILYDEEFEKFLNDVNYYIFYYYYYLSHK